MAPSSANASSCHLATPAMAWRIRTLDIPEDADNEPTMRTAEFARLLAESIGPDEESPESVPPSAASGVVLVSAEPSRPTQPTPVYLDGQDLQSVAEPPPLPPMFAPRKTIRLEEDHDARAEKRESLAPFAGAPVSLLRGHASAPWIVATGLLSLGTLLLLVALGVQSQRCDEHTAIWSRIAHASVLTKALH